MDVIRVTRAENSLMTRLFVTGFVWKILRVNGVLSLLNFQM